MCMGQCHLSEGVMSVSYAYNIYRSHGIVGLWERTVVGGLLPNPNWRGCRTAADTPEARKMVAAFIVESVI